ncbi:sialidase-1 [Prauserella shujinwangii]|uniref:exo-alpha-sialidase n=1 Tax=Prauserella shujinwangii TaxID=1453103 RepID=A0A2T0LZ60_9PSEU|nr:sialidase family protein [Prauserella shujinwangii]PRX49342.1 sialidase-1 [Prauserella shujinwangii]
MGSRVRGRPGRYRAAAVAVLAAAAAAAGPPGATAATSVSAEPATTAAVANTVVFRERSEGYDCFRIPAVLKAANGDLLAFAEGRNGGDRFCADAGDIDLVLKRSTDGGRTWSAPRVVIEGHGDTKGNPTPILVPETGRIVLLSTMECVRDADCGRVPRVQHSDDHGRSWTAPRVLTGELGFDRAPGWLATGPAHGIALRRGPHAGRLVAGVNYSIGGRHTGALIYSDDQGRTWHRGATDTSSTSAILPQELNLVELVDGRILATARNQANNDDKCLAGGTRNRLRAVSADGGESFSQRFTYETDLVTPTVQASVQRMSGTDQGDEYNRLLFAGPSTCDRRKELVVRSSFDEGGNWTPKSQGVLVWGQDAAYSDLVSLGATSVGVLYEAGPAGNANETIRWSRVTEADLGAPVCGSGYREIDSASLGPAGTVFLSYNPANGRNCVATMKASDVGTPTPTSAFLEVDGGSRSTDSGDFSYFAGPVRAEAAATCVRWGGAIGERSYTSPFEHCG